MVIFGQLEPAAMAIPIKVLNSCLAALIFVSSLPAPIEGAIRLLKDVATLAAAPDTTADSLPPQNLFEHGRQCGLPNATMDDLIAARSIRPRASIAEGGINIMVRCADHMSPGRTPDSDEAVHRPHLHKACVIGTSHDLNVFNDSSYDSIDCTCYITYV